MILPALVAGRCVVSNIDGLDPEAVGEYLDRVGTPQAGQLVVVDKLDPRKPDFFPIRDGAGGYRPSLLVPLGALVVVDEAPFYWGAGMTLPPAHLEFFREHRHIVGDDGVASDLVVISQTVDAIHRSLRGLVEFSLDCGKLSSLGLHRGYTVVSYAGAKRTKAAVMGRETRAYDKAIFPLYRSFAGPGGKIV